MQPKAELKANLLIDCLKIRVCGSFSLLLIHLKLAMQENYKLLLQAALTFILPVWSAVCFLSNVTFTVFMVSKNVILQSFIYMYKTKHLFFMCSA